MVNKPRRGFTLIELMVVLLVIGLLAGLVAPQIIGRVSDARVTTANAQIAMLGVALENYRLDNGSYPTTEQGLAALRARPTTPPAPTNWRGPYLKKDVPRDPWGRAYIYRTPAMNDSSGFELGTLGRDGRPGGSGEDKDLSGG
ncbi:MAG: type II secretion system major pseudopilin GspG [Gemmatimonadota bacterium]|nr:type II secretion system major pseudopilin GspG [Gemmatimonadota bacterium]